MDKKLQSQLSCIWAKSNDDQPQTIHLLLFHLLESAAVALILWQKSLSPSIKKEIADLLDVSIEETGNQLAYWVGLHDIGKASPVFQKQLEQKNPTLLAEIRASGLSIKKDCDPAYHSHISAKFIHDNFVAPREIEIAISGHHGLWDSDYSKISKDSYGLQEWDVVRNAFCETLRDVLGIQPLKALSLDTQKKNELVAWFSGFICVADWISSDEKKFPYQRIWMDPREYFKDALPRAHQVLQDIGWIGWHSDGKILTFQDMYPKFDDPNPIQRQAINAFTDYAADSPFLMVVEAPTGCGKTEIAMFLADQWLQQKDGSGLYIAMPTQATSNQIYHRSLEVLAQRYPNQKVNVVLAHGQAVWNEDLQKIRVAQVGDSQQDQSLLAAEWFQNNRKRTLLAPFGVGTVDQVFLSILQTKHFFVRLFGLKNKVIVFDEVHAYDTYMNTLFHRLLEWLHSLGTSVIILSATLPEKARKEIVAHYGNVPGEQVLPDSHYPRLTLACDGKEPRVFPVRLDFSDRTINIQWISEEEMPSVLKEKLSEGGCAAVICNTVRKAQETFSRLKEMQMVDEEDLILFHARYPVCWRNQIEKRVLKKFDKNSTLKDGSRPHKAIVVATQVIEQSLDLDFDLMVSELAPVDLILQRAGRLHRHERNDARPSKVSSPQMILMDVLKDEEQVPLVGTREPFYPKNVLLKTYHVLREITQLQVIASTRSLIEKVYDDQENWPEFSLEWNEKLEKWQKEEIAKREIKGDDASFTLIDAPSCKRLLYRQIKQLEESDEENVSTLKRMQARTRDGCLSVRFACLFTQDGSALYSDLECQQSLHEGMGEEEVFKRIARNEVGISNAWLLQTINQQAQNFCQYFPNIKKLKKRRFLLFQVDQKGAKLDIGDYHLELSCELGLTYQYGGNDVGI